MEDWERGIATPNTRTLVIEQEENHMQLVDLDRGSPSMRESSGYSLEGCDLSSLCGYTESCELDQQKFFDRFNRGDTFDSGLEDCPLRHTAWDLEAFFNKEGRYRPNRPPTFAGDVLLGLPENLASAQLPLPKLGLPAEFDSGNLPLTLDRSSNDSYPFWYGNQSTRLGRLGGKEAISKEPIEESERGTFYRKFETHGRLIPLIDQRIFMKLRIDQDLAAVLNEHYKDTSEEAIPKILSWGDASAILDQHLPRFSNQIEARNTSDREATLDGFVPASRLETNVIESEIQRRQNISKRPPDIDEKKRAQLDRKKKNKADYDARKKAERAAARHPGRL